MKTVSQMITRLTSGGLESDRNSSRPSFSHYVFSSAFQLPTTIKLSLRRSLGLQAYESEPDRYPRKNLSKSECPSNPPPAFNTSIKALQLRQVSHAQAGVIPKQLPKTTCKTGVIELTH